MSLWLGIGLGIIPTAARPSATTAPVNVVKPSFDGILTQGQSADVNPGSWTGLPSPNFTYAIKRSGVTVSTDPEYVWTAADVAAGVNAMTVEVSATNEAGATSATSDPVTIAPPLQLTGNPLVANVGSPYSFTPNLSGGHAPFHFNLSGTLPVGLSFNSSSGEISGTPTASGAAELSIGVVDADGLTASLGPFDLVVTSRPTESASSISKDGATAYFWADEDHSVPMEVPVGQYCNGDWWALINPANAPYVTTEPACAVVSGLYADGATPYTDRIVNGAQINPGNRADVGGSTAANQAGPNGQGFDSLGFPPDPGNASTRLPYSDGLNIDPAKPDGMPWRALECTLVKSISNLAPPVTGRAALSGMVPFTFVTSIPAEDAFRPAVAPASKVSLWREGQLDYSPLGAFARTPSAPQSTQDLAVIADGIARMYQVGYTENTSCRNISPSDNQPEYGRDIATRISEAALALQTDFTDAEKRDLLVYMVQMGIDLDGRVRLEGGVFPDLGGGSQGRKVAAVIAAICLNDPVLREWADASRHRSYSDDRQIFVVDQASLDTTPMYDDISIGAGGSGYTVGDVLTVVGGQAVTAGQATVTTVGAGGAVTSVSTSRQGNYYDHPSYPAATTGGTGAGCTLSTRPRNRYRENMLGMPEWGEQHLRQRNRDGSNWSTAFYRNNVGGSMFGATVAMHLMQGGWETWGSPDTRRYYDRYWNYERQNPPSEAANSIDPFAWEMREAYVPLSDAEGAPTLVDAFYGANRIWLMWDRVQDVQSLPSTDSFTVEVAGSPATVTSVEIVGLSTTLSLESAIPSGSGVSISYSGTEIRDIGHNVAATFIGRSVAEYAPETSPFHRVAFDGADRFVSAMATGAAAVDGQVGGFGWSGRIAARPAAQTQLFGGLTGNARVIITLETNGRLRLRLFSSTGAEIGRLESGDICNDVDHEVLFSWDLSKSTNIEGASVYVDGAARTLTGVPWVGGVCAYSDASQQYALGGTTARMITMQQDFFWLGFGARPDLSSPTVRANFKSDRIGDHGQGVIGSTPEWYLTGSASAWNAPQGINLGTRSKLIAADGSAVTDV